MGNGSTVAEKLAAELIGATVKAVARHPHQWVFELSSGRSLTVDCLWRIQAGGQFAMSRDSHTSSGNPEADGQPALDLLANALIVGVEQGLFDGDLRIGFKTGAILELISEFPQFEAWQLNGPDFVIVSAPGQLCELEESSPGIWTSTQQG